MAKKNPTPLWGSNQSTLNVTMKFVDPEMKTSHVVTIQGHRPLRLKERMDEMRKLALGWGWVIDQWPFVKDEEARLGESDEEIDIYYEYGVPTNPQDLMIFITSDEYSDLPANVKAQVVEDLQTFQAPPQAISKEMLEDLVGAQGETLYHLPDGATLEELPGRPAKWCPIHNEWMWKKKNGRGKWYSHPSDGGYCKGLKSSDAVLT